jgi:hypothetical protein
MSMYMICIYRHANLELRTFAFFATFGGIGIAAIGRIGVFLDNRARKKNKEFQDNAKKDTV